MAKRVKKNKAPQNFPEKWWKKLPSTWMGDDVQSKTTDELKEQILKSSQTISTQEKDMAADQSLQQAKERVKDLSLGYKEVIDSERAIINYSLYLINERGSSV